MSIIKTETNIPTLKINYLTQEMYDNALENDQINDNELYLTPSGSGGGGTPIPTADTVAEFDSSACMNSSDMSAQDISDFVDALNISTPATLVDFFYPIGSYYETSNASFNPNIAWNGTWTLVHSDINGDYIIEIQSKNISISSGMSTYSFEVDVPTGYTMASWVVARSPNANWVYGGVQYTDSTHVLFVYDNTYSGVITGDLSIMFAFKNNSTKYRWHRTA